MFDWLYGMCSAEIRTERDLTSGDLQKTRINLQDPCWTIFWVMSALLLLISLLWMLVASWWWLIAATTLFVVTLTMFLWVGANRFARIPETYLAVRGFLGRAHVFMGCLIFFLRKWTQTVLIPFDKDAKGQMIVDALVRMPAQEERQDMLETAKFSLRWAAQLDPDRPKAVIDAFYDDLLREAQFETHDGGDDPDVRMKKCMDKSREIIRREISGWLSASFDTFMSEQHYTVDEMVKHLREMSTALTTWFQEQALVLGVKVLSVQIEEIDSNWVRERVRATTAEAKAAADVREADAKRQARVAEAVADEAGKLRELDRDKEVADREVTTAASRSKAKLANALIDLQPLRAKLRAVRGQELQIAAVKIADMDAAQFQHMIEEIAKAGHSEVHTLVTLGAEGQIGDISPVVNLVRLFIEHFMSGGSKTTSTKINP